MDKAYPFLDLPASGKWGLMVGCDAHPEKIRMEILKRMNRLKFDGSENL
ncbi:MAG: hypothetical protein U9N31_06920 [Candidatus Marinimicrobia bacterium]|nr:hypothetical protein [Candidatus Neomarinimicrobiota bacterium]